jgi:hypothetical protein
MTRDELFALSASEGRTHLGDLADGTPVFTKKGPNHLASHPEVAALVPEVLATLTVADFTGRDLNKVVDLGRVVGISTCVETTDGDAIVFARRRGRKDGCTRFVRNREGNPTSTVVVRLFLNDQGLVALMTAFVGADAPAEPCSPSGRKDRGTWKSACTFWQSHALCWDGEVESDDFTATDFFGEPPTA